MRNKSSLIPVRHVMYEAEKLLHERSKETYMLSEHLIETTKNGLYATLEQSASSLNEGHALYQYSAPLSLRNAPKLSQKNCHVSEMLTSR